MTSTEPLPSTPGDATAIEVVGQVVGRTPWQLFWMRLRQDKAALAGLVGICSLAVLALVAPLIARYVIHHGPNDLFQNEMLNSYGLPRGPNGRFWFGADSVGRDVFVRVIYGTRTSLIVAVFATSFAMVIGVTLGIIAGFFRGPVDTLISRVIDIMLSMPLLLLAIGISAACSVTETGCLGGLIRPGLPTVIFIISIFSWSYIARIIRGQTFSIREREYVDASRSLGASNARIMFREVLPNLIAPIIIYSTLVIPANILFESYLSFLGLGIPQNIPSWGRMLSDAAEIFEVAWWLMLFPGLFLVFTTLSFNLLGDGLRDALDPKTGR